MSDTRPEELLKRIYSLYDRKAGIYVQPFILETDGIAERMFVDLCRFDKKSIVGQYPSDFELYYIGNFDQVSGTINARPKPKYIISGDDALCIIRRIDSEAERSAAASAPDGVAVRNDEEHDDEDMQTL